MVEGTNKGRQGRLLAKRMHLVARGVPQPLAMSLPEHEADVAIAMLDDYDLTSRKLSSRKEFQRINDSLSWLWTVVLASDCLLFACLVAVLKDFFS